MFWIIWLFFINIGLHNTLWIYDKRVKVLIFKILLMLGHKFIKLIPGGGTQYKSGYRDVPQTWVAKSGRQVHQWVPFFSKTWYFDGSIFQNFLKFAPKWRKFGTLIGQLFKIFRNLRQNGANFSEKFWFLVHGWVTFPSKWVHGWVAFQKSQRHTPTQTKVEYPPGANSHQLRVKNCSKRMNFTRKDLPQKSEEWYKKS